MSYWKCSCCGRVNAPKRVGEGRGRPHCPRCGRQVTRILKDGDRAARRNLAHHRSNLIERDGESCRWCGATTDLTIDHIVPLARGGTNRPDNLQLLCRDCNQLKGDRDFSDVAA